MYWHVSRSLAKLTGADADPEDLFQEGLIGLLKAVRTYDGVSSSFSTYASACVGNSVVSAVRKYRRQSAPSVPLEETPEVVVSSPESEVIDRESSSLLYARALSGLSAFERAVFERYLAGQSCSEVAKALGRPEKAVENAVCRSRRKLRTLLA